MHKIEAKVAGEDKGKKQTKVATEQDYQLQLFLRKTTTDHGYRDMLTHLLSVDKVNECPHKKISLTGSSKLGGSVERYEWAIEILNFFNIPSQFDRENRAAVRLQRMCHSLKLLNIKRRLL